MENTNETISINALSTDPNKIKPEAEKCLSFEKALEKCQFGKFNVLIILVGAMVVFVINCECYSISYVLVQAACELKCNVSQEGWLTSAGFLGIISTSHFWGFWSDTKGRKAVMVFCLLGSALSSNLSAFGALEYWSFIAFRFLNGVCLSGPIASVYAYVGEFHTDGRRCKSVAFASLAISAAFVLMPGLAFLIVNFTPCVKIIAVKYNAWRFFLFACGLPAVPAALMLIFLPESPKFLLRCGKEREALQVLQKMYSINTGNSPSSYPVEALLQDAAPSPRDGTPNFLKLVWDQTAPLFHRKFVLHTAYVGLVQFFLFGVSSGLFLWYPEIVRSVQSYLKSKGEYVTVCGALHWTKERFANVSENFGMCVDLRMSYEVLVKNTAIGVSYFAGLALVALCIGHSNKTALLVVCLSVSGVSSFALYFAKFPMLVNVLFIGLLVLSGLCVTVVTTIVVDLFPTYLRAMSLSLSLMMGRLGSVVVSTVMGTILNYSCFSTFITFGVLLCACAVLTIIIPKRITTECSSSTNALV